MLTLLSVQIVCRPARFVVSGCMGNVVFFIMYKACFDLLPGSAHKATLAWVTSYLSSIPLQHFFNLFLVFGSTLHYWKSLGVSYAAYSMSVAISSILNAVLGT